MRLDGSVQHANPCILTWACPCRSPLAQHCSGKSVVPVAPGAVGCRLQCLVAYSASPYGWPKSYACISAAAFRQLSCVSAAAFQQLCDLQCQHAVDAWLRCCCSIHLYILWLSVLQDYSCSELYCFYAPQLYCFKGTGMLPRPLSGCCQPRCMWLANACTNPWAHVLYAPRLYCPKGIGGVTSIAWWLLSAALHFACQCMHEVLGSCAP